MSEKLITEEREHERAQEESIAANLHGAMRDVRDSKSDSVTAQLVGMVDRLQTRFLDHMLEEKETVKELQGFIERLDSKVSDFISAFPDGDATSHRIAHEVQMKLARESHDFWSKIKFTLVALLLTAATSWVVFVVWKAFLIGPK